MCVLVALLFFLTRFFFLLWAIFGPFLPRASLLFILVTILLLYSYTVQPVYTVHSVNLCKGWWCDMLLNLTLCPEMSMFSYVCILV